MKTLFYCPYWGMESMPLAEAAKKVKAAGYDGMEVALGPDKVAEAKAVRDQGLDLILLAFGGSANFPEHKKQFRTDLEKIAAAKPRYVNSHTGRDFFSYEQNCELVQVADEVQRATGIKIRDYVRLIS
jgi:sugar phosphate isomerase/epimerase